MATDDQWRLPDALWERIEPLLPPGKPHRFGGHRPRVDNRRAMDAIFFVARTAGSKSGTKPASSAGSGRWAWRSTTS